MDPQQKAAQLRCPSGEQALDTAHGMNQANGPLNRRCIELLQLKDSNSILEVGPGNGAFVPEIIKQARDTSYVGVDWSPEMVAEARRINAPLLADGVAAFHQSSSDQMPFHAGRFDKALAVHALYFWKRPSEHFAEIHRVMKPSGLFCLAFGDREFMGELPFVAYGFNLHAVEEVGAMLREAGFSDIAHHPYHERGRSNTGEVVDKRIHIMTCKAWQQTTRKTTTASQNVRLKA